MRLAKLARLKREIHELREDLAKLEALKAELNKKIVANLTAQKLACIKEHGHHEDDDGMFHGFCKRCSADLG